MVFGFGVAGLLGIGPRGDVRLVLDVEQVAHLVRVRVRVRVRVWI